MEKCGVWGCATRKAFARGTNIPNANASSYKTPAVLRGDSGTKYSVKATVPGAEITSAEAILTPLPRMVAVPSPLTVRGPAVTSRSANSPSRSLLPVIPEINVVVPRVKVIRSGTRQPI